MNSKTSKRIKTWLTMGFVLLCISFSTAQEEETFDHPDLDNPKIQKIEKILEAETWDWNELNKRYDDIYFGNNKLDKLHLFIFDLSHPKGPFGDYLVKYSKEVTPILQTADELPKTDYKDFVTAVIYNRVAKVTYKDPEQKTKHLNTSFHIFLNRALKGDNRSIIPLAWAATELYILDFKDDHLSEELILNAYNHYLTMGVDIKNLTRYLTDGLHYVNHYGLPLSEDEAQEKLRYKNITYKIIKNYLANYPEASSFLIYDFWTNSLLEKGFDTHKVRYDPEIGNSLNQLISEFNKESETEDVSIKSLNFLFRYFIDPEAKLRLEDYVKMFDSREMAYDHFTMFLDEISKHDYLPLDFLSVKPKWASFFKYEIDQNLNKMFPYVVRFSDEASMFYLNSKIETSTIKEVMKTANKITNAMVNRTIDTGVALYTLYQYRLFMIDLMKANYYQNDSELKWELAKIVLDFEMGYLAMNEIHSPFVLGISDHFDNWTPSEVQKYKEYVKITANNYITNYRKLVVESLESGIVENEFASILKKMGIS